jgi:hypothetical protein
MIKDNIKQVVIWGYKFYGNTYCYVHGAFFKAFQFLGYKTLWLDNDDDISTIDFSGTLFITAGNSESNMPKRDDSFYILHNVDTSNYIIPKTHIINLQVYTNDVINKHFAILMNRDTLTYYKDNTIYLPWATDLLPHEINTNIGKLKYNNVITKNETVFAGIYDNYWNDVVEF